MLGRLLLCTCSVLLVTEVCEVSPDSVLRAADPPAAAPTDQQNRPLDLASDLLLIRARNQELLVQLQNKRVSLELRNAPLDHAIAHLSELSGIPMILDTVALEELGLPADTECSVRVKEARVSSVLSRMLKRFDLGWTIENESLQITTNEVVSEKLQTMVFAVGDLVEWFEKNSRRDDRRDRFGFSESEEVNGVQTSGFSNDVKADDVVMDLIQQHCGGFWEEIDGAGGTVRFEGGMLTVRQELPVLLQVDSFLKRLRIVQQQPPTLDVWAIPEGGFGWPENRKAMEALRKHVPVKLKDVPLSQAIAILAKELNIQIDIDVPALDENGLLDNEPVTLTMSGTASAVLKQLLGKLQLTWIILDDTLLVTTLEASEDYLFAVVADTRPLFATGRFTDDGLNETIQFETNGMWEDLDGAGGMIRTVGGLTFIRQTQATIGEVAVLLKDLKARAVTTDSSKSESKAVKSGAMETRFYLAESKDDGESLMTALTSFVFPGTWETNGGEGVMVQVGSRLVIRQTPAVHKAIAEFIRELQSAGT
jgi:hypothetical protein